MAHNHVRDAARRLGDPSVPMGERYRALFFLRGGGDVCVNHIGRCMLGETDNLLKHDEAFCLGQMGRPSAIPFLVQTLENLQDDSMVRHEAGEALGAIGNDGAEVIETLERFRQDPEPVVAQTCELALQRISYVNNKGMGDGQAHTNSPYASIDPTPVSNECDVKKLESILLNTEETIWERYRAMFSLRNINTPESIVALARGLECEDSALLRHEVAYVLGQLQNPVAIPQLETTLANLEERGMVRHECAEALGAIATPEAANILRRFVNDREAVVRTSCVVALDMVDHEESGDFQYARHN
uniref:Deoxyhypusine hydroxylase n=1 Tax=Steinernema glaseri TaxID=37863 RepID=A0A1I8AQ13_9BILA